LLSIVKQSSPFEERITRNGIQRDIHVVIKNSPFMVQFAVAKNCEIDLNHVAFDATLLYDTEGEKGVDFVKVKPIEYKCAPNETGDQVAMELRIKVLTSQHEDMFFKVRIQGLDPVTKQEIPNLKVLTCPIKVISKPEQLKKRQPPPPSKKRTVNDMVVEAITRIEKQQMEQCVLLEKLMDVVATPPSPSPHVVVPLPTKAEVQIPPATSWEFLVPLGRQRKELEHSDFELSLGQVLKTFASTDPNHRAEKVRRIVRNFSIAENECLSELVDMLATEGLNQDGRESRPMGALVLDKHCTCTQCPHKQDMEKIDNIFFTSMIPPYHANANVLNASASSVGSLNNSMDGESHYSDFLATPPPNEYLM